MKKKLVVPIVLVVLAVPAGLLARVALEPPPPEPSGPASGPDPSAGSPGATRLVAADDAIGGAAGAPSAAGAVRPIAWARAEPGDGAAMRYLSGIVRAGERAPLAFEIGGRIARVEVEVGERFAAGEALAALDDAALELELAERRAALSEAEAALADGRRDFERKRSLHRDGVEPEASYLSARARLATFESRVAVARTLIESARERLADATLVAPFAGSVAERRVEPAEFVQAGTPVLEVLGDGGGHEITVRVPDTMIDRLEVGTAHRVALGRAPERRLDARVVEIGSRAATGAAFPVTLRLEESDRPPRAGTVAEVELALSADDAAERDALGVPATAVVAGPGDTSHVFVFDETASTVGRREVRVRSIEGGRTLVTGELAAGEIVASRGASFLVDGQTVELMGIGIARFDL